MSESHQQRRLRWQAVLQQHRDSGQTIAEFVRAQGLCRQKFYAWRRRLELPSEGAVASAPVEAADPPAFVPVTPTRWEDRDAGKIDAGKIEVHLRHRRRLVVPGGFDRSHLIAVVRALEEA